MSKQTIYFGRFIDTPSADELRIRIGAVLVSAKDGEGIIEKADWTVNGPNDAASKLGVEASVVTAKEDGFFFPGFIDTHIHASQYPNCGIFGKSTLLDWLTTYTFPLESSLGNLKSPMYINNSTNSHIPPDPLSRAKQVYSRILSKTLSLGTTTASYYATISVEATNLLASLAFDKGQRAFIGRVCMDDPSTCPDYYRDESTEQTVTNTLATIEYCKHLDPTSTLIAPIITPRFAPSCLPSTLSALGSLSDQHNLLIQTHISENLNEVALVKSMFPDQSYAEVYDAHSLLTPRTILAHAVHLSSEEITLIKSRNAKISHCPASNSALGSGFCPVRTLLNSGVDVGLGTDVSGGVYQWRESKYNIGVIEGLYLATIGGAKVVGMQGRIGGFEEGMFFDVQEIQLGSADDGGEIEAGIDGDGGVDIFGWETWEDRVAKWVWNGDDRNVRSVWVGGRLVHERKS